MADQCKATTNSGTRCQNSVQEGSDYCHVPSHGEEKQESDLTPKQERFCQLYVSEEFFGNGVQSYMEAYDYDREKYDSARALASKLLTKVNICDRINELLDEAGLNDNFVDKQLLMMITQNADFSNKMAAIREYNKVKGRIIQKTEDVTEEPKRLVLVEGGSDG